MGDIFKEQLVSVEIPVQESNKYTSMRIIV